jgi:hypothetical protein
MKKSVRNVTLVIFLCIVIGCAFAVLYLGTSTGLTFGGSGTRLVTQSKTFAVYGQVGWLQNTAPWPITIQSVTTNSINQSTPPAVYLETAQSTPTKQSGKTPTWALGASRTPYQLNGGSLRYLGFALTPKPGQVAAMTTITVDYTGPLGLRFSKTFGGTRVAAGSSTLPEGLLGVAPYGNPGSLNDYIAALRTALLQPDPKTIAVVMGGDATDAQAQAFITAQKGYAATDSVATTVVTSDGRQQRIVFYHGDPTKGGLPPISVQWAHYRWNIVLAGN